MKRCSIIIPAYNVERYVGFAVASAFSQSYPEVEVTVVNDGSTDGTTRVAAPLRDRIVCIDQPHRGVTAARNRALREATGEYRALLDADDLYFPTRIERMLAYLEARTDVGFATSDAYVMHDQRLTADRYYYDPFPNEHQPYEIFRRNFFMGMAVILRELFERHGAYAEELRTSEDWDLWIRFIWGGERAGYVGEPARLYRRARARLSALET